MKSTLRLAIWNSNGLMNHLPEIEIFLHEEQIDVLLISESHFTKHSHASIKGYKFYNALHPAQKARGGATIIIKENIRHQEEQKLENEMFQLACVSVDLKNHKSFKICAIYSPPKHNIKSDQYHEMLKPLGNHFIVGGDFNAKNKIWGSRLTSAKGTELFKAARNLNCEFYSGNEPTYWPTNKDRIPDLIDFYIAKGISKNYIHLQNCSELSSDHTPVIMTISESVIQKQDTPFLVNNKTNWELFTYLLSDKISLQKPLKTKNQIEDEVDNLIEAIQLSAWESSPKPQKPNNNSTYPKEIRELVAKKRKARKKWQTERTTENKTILNRLCTELKCLINEVKNNTMSSHLMSLSANKDTNYSLWKATKQFNHVSPQIPPIRKPDGTWSRNAKDKCESFANHLQDIFKPLPRQSSEENINKVYKDDKKAIKPVKMGDLKYIIDKDLSPKKAPGYDLITGKIIKKLPDKALIKLMHIINACFRLRYVPMQWKVAEVIVIPKPGKPPNELTSYRPISILPVMSKIFEKLLLKRLQPIIEERNLIPSHQFGFRERHSTIQQVHRIVDVAEKALETKQVCSAVFLDVSQAFDRVWHQGLLYKLHRDLPKEFYEIMKSYVSDRHFRVKLDDEYSKLKNIEAGVPQGSVLGPIIYLLYTRDLPVSNTATIATFADDTAILSTGTTEKEAVNKLQVALTKTSSWIKKWRMQLNESKSTHINFTNKKVDNLPVFLNNSQIPYANTAKYLGMTLDTKIKWKEHVKKKSQEMKLKFKHLYWLLSRNSPVSLNNKLLLYNQTIKPIWTYGIQLWGCAKKCDIQTIQKNQNKILRTIVDAPWYIRNDDLHRDLKIKTVFEETKFFAQKHAIQLQLHTNVDLNNIFYSQNLQRRLQRRLPMDLAIL